MKIRYRFIALMLYLMLALCACSGKGEAPDEQPAPDVKGMGAAEEEKPGEEEDSDRARLDEISPSAYNNADGITLEKGSYISVIGKSDKAQFWDEVKEGAQRAVADINEELGYEGKDKVKLAYNGPAEAESVDEQVNILDEELARYPTAVAISIADTKACEVQFDLAAENNIPVVAFDSGSEYKGLMAMVSTDNQKASQEAAQHMAEELDGEAEIVVIAHDSKSETALIRENVFAETIQSSYPQFQVAAYRMDEMQRTVADEINEGKYLIGEGEPSGEPLAEESRIAPESVTKENVIDYIVKKHPNARGYYATNGESVMTVADGLSRAGIEDAVLMGYDADKKELEALKDGRISGLIVQNPYGMGYASVIAASRAALQIGNEAWIDTGYTWVTKENAEDEKIQEILY
ncbi:MAG: substrate-binding domain-containing protein [Dorea sp.]|jgi:ABC-type sugar transport system substrate-binding protein|nr:substrate-binding domain-containing protein [Dorea sp.]